MTKYSYNPDFIKEHLFVEDVPVKTKFGVAHGGRGSSAELARQSARAQLKGEVDKLVFVGGARVLDPLTLAGIASFNHKYFTNDGLRGMFNKASEFLSLKKEALLMADIAMEEGVRSEDIIIEGNGNPTSQHTGEHIDFTLRDASLKQDIVSEGSLKVFGLVYNTRRICGTWQKKVCEDMGENLIIVPKSFYPYGFTENNWHESDDIRNRIVYPEMAKIDPENTNSHFYKTNDVVQYDADKHRENALAILAEIKMTVEND